MNLDFDTTFAAVRACFEEADIAAEVTQFLQGITIVRDVHGIIRVYLEADNDGDISEQSLDSLKSQLRDRLQGFFGDDVWLLRGDEQGIEATLINMVRTERFPATWDSREQSPRWYILERRIAKQHWTDRSSVTPPWPITDVDNRQRPAVVTFYSFKGGLGRTTALAATALSLARRGLRVGMIDLDLEAPGLASVFLREDATYDGVVDYLLEKPIQKSAFSIQNYLQTISGDWLGDQGAVLRIMPAATIDGRYLEKLARLDYFHSLNGNFAELVNGMIRDFDDLHHLDFVLLDARAGFHDLGGLAVSGLSHAVVLFGTHSRQSWAGITQVIRRISTTPTEEEVPVLLVHAMAPSLRDPNWEQELAAFQEKAYDSFKEHYYVESDTPVPNQNDTDAAFRPIVIPWNETLRGDISLQRDNETSLGSSRVAQLVRILTDEPYCDLAKRLCQLFDREF